MGEEVEHLSITKVAQGLVQFHHLEPAFDVKLFELEYMLTNIASGGKENENEDAGKITISQIELIEFLERSVGVSEAGLEKFAYQFRGHL